MDGMAKYVPLLRSGSVSFVSHHGFPPMALRNAVTSPRLSREEAGEDALKLVAPREAASETLEPPHPPGDVLPFRVQCLLPCPGLPWGLQLQAPGPRPAHGARALPQLAPSPDRSPSVALRHALPGRFGHGAGEVIPCGAPRLEREAGGAGSRERVEPDSAGPPRAGRRARLPGGSPGGPRGGGTQDLFRQQGAPELASEPRLGACGRGPTRARAVKRWKPGAPGPRGRDHARPATGQGGNPPPSRAQAKVAEAAPAAARRPPPSRAQAKGRGRGWVPVRTASWRCWRGTLRRAGGGLRRVPPPPPRGRRVRAAVFSRLSPVPPRPREAVADGHCGPGSPAADPLAGRTDM